MVDVRHGYALLVVAALCGSLGCGGSESDAPDLSIYVVGRAIGFEVSSPSAFDLGDVPSGVPVERSVTITALIALSDLTVSVNSENDSVNESANTCAQTLAAGTA